MKTPIALRAAAFLQAGPRPLKFSWQHLQNLIPSHQEQRHERIYVCTVGLPLHLQLTLRYSTSLSMVVLSHKNIAVHLDWITNDSPGKMSEFFRIGEIDSFFPKFWRIPLFFDATWGIPRLADLQRASHRRCSQWTGWCCAPGLSLVNPAVTVRGVLF